MADLGSEERPMIWDKRRPPGGITILVGAILLGPGWRPARAQFGMYLGGGMGFLGGFNQVPSPTDFLNQHALTRAAAGRPAPTSFRPYANSPNAYFNRIRDNGFVAHSDVR